MKSWIDDPVVQCTGLVRLDDFSVIRQVVKEELTHSHSVPYLREYQIIWQFFASVFIQDGQPLDFSVAHAKKALRAELYKDITACLYRMDLALANRDLKAAHLVLEQLFSITRP